MSYSWRFPSNNNGVTEGFNNPSIDIFHGRVIDSLVREVLQNSIDAKFESDQPVHVSFQLHRFAIDQHEEIAGLRVPLSAGRKVSQKPELKPTKKEIDFYARAERLLDPPADNVTALGIHDFNTTGLTGSFDPSKKSPWTGLVHASGQTVKSSASAGGSYGHGSAAPFAFSDLRTAFYYTRIDEQAGPEERFQGKAILQSLPLADLGVAAEGLSQATGFLSDNEKNHPIFNEAIPSWPKEFREAHAPTHHQGFGTSLYVMAPRAGGDEGDFWARIAVAVIANFYFAIATGRLVVEVGEMLLSKTSVEEHLDFFCTDDRLKELNLQDATIRAVESARTIAHSTHSGEIELEDFGKISWFMRLGDEVERKALGVARSSGMLITREPPKIGFHGQGFRNFDMFACVEGLEGSAFLAQLENPEHTQFEFDRLEDESDKKEAERVYRGFTQAMKAIVREHAAFAEQEELWTSQLDEFFSDFSGGDDTGEDESASISLRVSPPKRHRPREGVPTDVLDGSEQFATGRFGESPGIGNKKTDEKNFDDPFGEATKPSKKMSGRQVKNLRISRVNGEENVADVYFTPVDKSRRHLVLSVSGETQRYPIRFKPAAGGDWRTRHDVGALQGNMRKQLRLEFPPGVLDKPIEGRLEP